MIKTYKHKNIKTYSFKFYKLIQSMNNKGFLVNAGIIFWEVYEWPRSLKYSLMSV